MISGLEKGRTRTIVIALGGNALQPPAGHGGIQQQFAHTRESLAVVIALAAAGWRIVIVHGNGPQIGDELLRNELARSRRPPLPLGVLVASTAGWIGYMIQQSLRNALDRAGIARPVMTVVTQVLVDASDLRPRKPIGVAMSREQAETIAAELGWDMACDDDGWRRMVASPRPYAVVESEQIQRASDNGTIVIACGGGGTPIREDPHRGFDGVDAVVDKDRAAAILARDLGADVLLILTDVDAAYCGWGTPTRRRLDRLTATEAAALHEAGEFAEGSMGPKVEAAIDFVRGGGQRAIIARLERGLDAVAGRTGTTVVPD